MTRRNRIIDVDLDDDDNDDDDHDDYDEIIKLKFFFLSYPAIHTQELFDPMDATTIYRKKN